MNLTDETLSPHGGLAKNNLNDIFDLDDEYINEDDFAMQTRFKLSPYHDENNIKDYSNLNKNVLIIN